MNAKTYTLRESEIDRRWYVVDATDQTLGRLASRVARVLEGKHKPTYTNLDSGDHVIVLNVARIAVTRDARVEITLATATPGPGGDAGHFPRPPARRSSAGRSRACCRAIDSEPSSSAS
jgi:large subunit ribosomal protein L13